MRTTRRRTALLNVLQTSDRFLCARELHLALSRRGDSLALSTVYRALQCLVDGGEVRRICGDLRVVCPITSIRMTGFCS